jgi:hypothetical protein
MRKAGCTPRRKVREGRNVPPPPAPSSSEEGSSRFPSLDKEGSGVVGRFVRFFVFIDIPGSFVEKRLSTASPRGAKCVKVAESHHPLPSSSSEERSSRFPSLDQEGRGVVGSHVAGPSDTKSAQIPTKTTVPASPDNCSL